MLKSYASSSTFSSHRKPETVAVSSLCLKPAGDYQLMLFVNLTKKSRVKPEIQKIQCLIGGSARFQLHAAINAKKHC
jgi:hypothetical protein